MTKKVLIVSGLATIVLIGCFAYKTFLNKQNSYKQVRSPSEKITQNITDYQNLRTAFSEKGGVIDNGDGCIWELSVASVEEFVPGRLVLLSTGFYLSEIKTKKCSYSIGDGYPSEGQMLLGVKDGNKWQFINRPDDMCSYIVGVPEASSFLSNLQNYYGSCK